MPNYTPGDLDINHNPRNGKPYFNTALFTPNALGTQGNAKRRFFYGPGINNFDMALHNLTKITETKALEFRFEAFNPFNHAQFYPNGSVDGNINENVLLAKSGSCSTLYQMYWPPNLRVCLPTTFEKLSLA